MCEKRTNLRIAAPGQLNETGRQLFAVYGQHGQSPVLTWLPILLGLFASAIVALALCPLPRSDNLSAARALFLAVAYVMETVGIGAGVLAASGTVLGWRKSELSGWWVLPIFGSVAAWMTPLVAFYRRDSLWAALAAFVLSMFGSRLIYRYHLATRALEMFPSFESQITELPPTTRLTSLTFAVLVLQLGVLSIMASMAHPATILIGIAIIVISLFRQTASQSQVESQFPKPVLRFSIMLGLAIILVAASLTPYLAVPSEDASTTDATTEHSTAKAAGSSAKRKASLLQSVGSWFRRFLADDPHAGAKGRPGDGASSSPRPYSALQALLGEGETASGSESSSLKKKLNKGNSTMLVEDDAVPGIILRPKIEDYVTIVPPLPTRRVFDGKPNDRRADRVSIPFYGTYWFFRASEKTLPADAVELRGDADSTSFKTTDFSPISMEARQNFGSLIELSWCSAVELIISNGDRRPGTVAVELILTNTTLPGQPHQSLGLAPVNSTLRWFPGDNRPAVKEVLTFRVPAQAAIQSFDEATIRFELRSPRERWSAKIAIEKFRLISRGL
jgi:uncharacterized membrane protein YidH (DUF202 family)